MVFAGGITGITTTGNLPREERVRATGDNKTIKTVVKKTPSTSAAVESRNKRARKTPRWMWGLGSYYSEETARRRRRRPTPNLEESWHLLLRSSTTPPPHSFIRDDREHRGTKRGTNERERRKDGEGRKEESIKLFRQIDVLRARSLAVVASARRYRPTRRALLRPSERAEGIHATRD